MGNWAKIINRRPWLVVAVMLVLTVAAAGYGLGVFSKLTGGRDVDPKTESAQAAKIIDSNFKGQDFQLIGLFTGDQLTVDSAAYKQAVQSRVDKIKTYPQIKTVVSYYGSRESGGGQPSFVSKNRHQTYVAIRLSGTKKDQAATFKALEALPQPEAGLKLAYGGSTAISAQINDQVEHDLVFAEMVSFPLLAILLFLVFRSLAATLAPLALGGMSIVGAFALVRVLSIFTDMSIYSINIITIMGLGLAIDYSLFIISRFREELASGKTAEELAGGSATEAAITKTLVTAGRTVMFSGLTVILCLLSLLIFPLSLLNSIGLGGSAAVLAAVVLSITVLPAVLRLLGHRINWLSIGRHDRAARPPADGAWYKICLIVMRRPLVSIIVTLAVLLTLGSPFLSAKLSMPDTSIVPEKLSSRQVSDAMSNNFAGAGVPVIVVITANRQDPSAVTKTNDYIARIKKLTGVTTTVNGAISGDVQVVKAYTKFDPQSADAQNLVKQLRAIQPPSGLKAQIGGESAELVDLLHSLASKLPLALTLIVVAITILLFLMLGSVIIPIKAITLNILSLSAAFGILVWIFQDGHFAGTLNLVALGNIDAMQPVLIFAIAFGLAMDYELFLVSRIKESYDTGVTNEVATATGVQKTAAIITSAALLLVVVIGAFATSRITIIEQVGVGLAAAVIIDATIVRLVLLPASMRLLGRWNWWAPKPLRELRGRFGLKKEL